MNVRNVATMAGTSSVTLDATNVPGLTAFNADRSTATVAVTNLATGAAGGMIGNGTVANGALNLGYKTTTDAATINISGGTVNTGNAAKIAVTSNAATAATINSTGATNTVDTVALSAGTTVTALTINADSSLTTGTISGFKNGVATNTITVKGGASAVPTGQTAAVNLGTVDATIGTLDASGLTAGGVSATTAAATTGFKGGAGKDVLTIGATLVQTATLDGGAGTADVVAVSTGAQLTAATAAKITNFEVLQVSSAATQTYDYSLISGLTGLNVDTGTSIIVNKLGASTPVKVIGNQTANLTLNLATATGTSDVMNATLENQDASAAALTVDKLSITGVETLNITSSAVKAGTNANVITTLAGTDNTALSKVTIAGSQAFTLTDTGALSQSLTIDGSAATGKLTISAASLGGSATITGGSGADTFTGSAQADTINGGAGNDTFNLGAGADTLSGGDGNDTYVSATNSFAATAGLVIDGGAGTDTIKVDATAGAVAIDLSTATVAINGIEAINLASATGNNAGIIFNGSQINTQAWAVTGGVAVDTLTVNATPGASVSLANLTFSGWTAGTDIISLNGSTGNETLVGSSQRDVITGGNGIDTITTGAGIDTIVVATAGTNRDIITDFTAGATNGDILSLAGAKANNAVITAGAGSATSVVTVSASGSLTGAASQGMFVITVENAASLSTDGASVLNALVTGAGSGTITAANAADVLYFAISDGTNVGIYRGAASGVTADTAITVDEIALVGTLQNVSLGGLAAASNILFA